MNVPNTPLWRQTLPVLPTGRPTLFLNTFLCKLVFIWFALFLFSFPFSNISSRRRKTLQYRWMCICHSQLCNNGILKNICCNIPIQRKCIIQWTFEADTPESSNYQYEKILQAHRANTRKYCRLTEPIQENIGWKR